MWLGKGTAFFQIVMRQYIFQDNEWIKRGRKKIKIQEGLRKFGSGGSKKTYTEICSLDLKHKQYMQFSEEIRNVWVRQ